MKNYILTLKHDTGSIKIKTRAESMEAAIKAVTTAENCPEGAITKIKEEQITYHHTNRKLINLNSFQKEYQTRDRITREPGESFKTLKEARQHCKNW
jgi:hypothetical protein